MSAFPAFGVTVSNSTVEADAEISSQGLSEFVTTLILNAAIGFVLLALFEIKRSKRSVYAPRLEKLPNRTPPVLPYGPLRWVKSVALLSGPETLRLAGMDAYCLLRFNYLCLRICLFASFWGAAVLTPIYACADGDATGIYYITLANVVKGSNILWATVVFSYLFTWHALYVLRGEHQVFAEMREDFLAKGDPDFATQTRYTTKVENVPAELRSAVALEGYFDDLFPGQVHSAVMCLDMPKLEDKVEKREIIADKLEKTRSLELASGQTIMHRHRRSPCDCCGTTSGLSEAEFLAGELDKLNNEIKKEQKAFLRAAQRLNSMDDRLMHGGRSPNGEEARGDGGDNDTSPNTGWPMGKLERFLRSKTQRESRWAMEEEEDTVDDSGTSSVNPASDDERGHGTTLQSGDSAGIDEALEASRRRSGGAAVTPKPGPRPGASSAIEDDRPMGVGGLIENAPDLAKDALSSLTFVGNTAFNTTRRVARGMLYLTLGERMSNTGFVTFRQMSACAAARQVLVAPRPDWCDCEPAPEPRDIVWANIAVPQQQSDVRHQVATFLVAMGAIFWSIPVALVQLWASFDELEKLFPWLGDLDEDSVLYSLISGYLPVAALLLLMLVLPFLFQMLAYRYERRKSHSDVQQSVLTRYFTYQVANIYVTVASGSIVSALEAIVQDPTSVLNILGETFPAVAVYFLDLIVVKLLAGLTFELLRGWPLIRVMWSQKCTNRAYATEREVRTGPFGPSELLYGWVYPTLLLVLVVCFVYAVISPFIMPAGALFFACSYLVYKHQVLYVYVPKYESGGVFWFSVYLRVLVGLALAQLTLAGYVYVRGGYEQATLILLLPVFIYWYGYRSYKRYLGPAESISLETAARIDRRGAAAIASTVKSAETRRGKRWQGGTVGPREEGEGDEGARGDGVNPDNFEPLLYAQLALTSPTVEPDDCSPRESAIEASRRKHGHGEDGADGVGPDHAVTARGISLDTRTSVGTTVSPFLRETQAGSWRQLGSSYGSLSATVVSDRELGLQVPPFGDEETGGSRKSGSPIGTELTAAAAAAAVANTVCSLAGDDKAVRGLAKAAADKPNASESEKIEGTTVAESMASSPGMAAAAVGDVEGGTEEASLTRREKEGMKRRALAATAIASSSSWARRSRDKTGTPFL